MICSSLYELESNSTHVHEEHDLINVQKTIKAETCCVRYADTDADTRYNDTATLPLRC